MFKKINPSRIYLEELLRQEAIKTIGLDYRILDAGAGEGFYRSLFKHTQYHATDFCKIDKVYSKPAYICDLSAIPVAEQKYDLVICTQVLEHVPDPFAVICEFYRVLKPNGRLFLSAPFFYEEHEIPYDFYRYTRYGLRNLVERAGFEINNLEWLEGYLGSLSYQFDVAARSLPSTLSEMTEIASHLGLFAVGFLFIIRPVFRVLNRIFSMFEMRYKYTKKGFGKNYVLIASKI